MNPLVEIVDELTSSRFWTTVVVLTAAYSWLINGMLDKEWNRQQLDQILAARPYTRIYQTMLTNVLDRIDRILTPSVGPSERVRTAEGRREWSWPLFEISLRLSMIYPVFSILLAWGWFGFDGKLGTMVILPSADWTFRVWCFGVLLLTIWILYSLYKNRHRGRWIWLAFPLFLFLASSFCLAFADALGIRPSEPNVIMIALPVAVTIVFCSAIDGVGPLAVATLIPTGIFLAGAIASAGYADGVGAVFVTVTVALGGSFAVSLIARSLAKTTKYGLMSYLMLTAGLAFCLFCAVGWAPVVHASVATWIVFLSVLPIINALFDFISIGLTRCLLRIGCSSLGDRVLICAVSDLVGAVILFFFLGISLITSIHHLNQQALTEIVDLQQFFSDIRSDPHSYIWLYVTIFSTLLPTLLHFALASFSALLAIMPESLALFVRRQLPRVEEDAVAKALAFWTLSTIGFLAIAAVAFGLYGLVTGVLAAFPYAGDVYLYWFERYAAWLGAPVVPVWPGWL